MDLIWDGVTKIATLNENNNELMQDLFINTKNGDWGNVLLTLDENPELINSTRPGGSSYFTLLHAATHENAPENVITSIIDRGAWRTLKTSKGKRAVDIAKDCRFNNLIEILTPVYKRVITMKALEKLQSNFHNLIMQRAGSLIEEHKMRLPELEPLLEIDKCSVWFAIPGMYGGFSFILEDAGEEPKLIASSWCRVSEGSGQRHEITCNGVSLIEEGFV